MMISKKDSKQKSMWDVQTTSFAVDEAQLYLDTHPEDEKAKRYFDKHNEMRKKAIHSYNEKYGAIQSGDINAVKDGWTWTEKPFPWDEGE